MRPMVYGVLLVFSTANGMGNFFHTLYLDAQLPDSEWKTAFHPWTAVADRTQEWYDKKARAYRGRKWVLFQEYPSTAAEAFAKSGRTAWEIGVLEEEMDFREPEWVIDLAKVDYGVGMEEQWDEVQTDGAEAELELHLWALPAVDRTEQGIVEREPNYVISVDVAEGLEDGDATSVDIFDANEGEQVGSMVAQFTGSHVGCDGSHVG